jgi:hypothetical protein
VEINHFKVFALCSGDVAAGVSHLYVKRIHLMDSSYIVIWDLCIFSYNLYIIKNRGI